MQKTIKFANLGHADKQIVFPLSQLFYLNQLEFNIENYSPLSNMKIGTATQNYVQDRWW